VTGRGKLGRLAASEQRSERRFASAGIADEGYSLGLADFEIDTREQRSNAARAFDVRGECFDLQHVVIRGSVSSAARANVVDFELGRCALDARFVADAVGGFVRHFEAQAVVVSGVGLQIASELGHVHAQGSESTRSGPTFCARKASAWSLSAAPL
jgi:hypothetical protein